MGCSRRKADVSDGGRMKVRLADEVSFKLVIFNGGLLDLSCLGKHRTRELRKNAEQTIVFRIGR